MDQAFYEEYFRIEDEHWWFLGRRRVIRALLEERFGADTDPEREILDVGCGTGMMLGFLGDFGHVRGIDSDEGAVSYCHRRGFTEVVRVEDMTLPFEDSSFDLVTTLDVLEHIDDDAGMLAEIHRVLKPGGVLLATVPAYRFLWGPQDEISHHKRRYSRRELRSRIAETGFRAERLTFFNTLLFPGIAAIRLWRRWLPSNGPLRSDFEITEPGRLNDFLARAFGSEAALVRRINLPFGVSILAMASRPVR